MQEVDDIRSDGGPIPGVKAGAVSGSAVLVYVLVAWHLSTVPQTNEPENLQRSIQHVALMTVLVIVTFVAAVIALIRGAFGGRTRGAMRAVPILLGLFGLLAAAVCSLVVFAALLATRDA